MCSELRSPCLRPHGVRRRVFCHRNIRLSPVISPRLLRSHSFARRERACIRHNHRRRTFVRCIYYCICAVHSLYASVHRYIYVVRSALQWVYTLVFVLSFGVRMPVAHSTRQSIRRSALISVHGDFRQVVVVVDQMHPIHRRTANWQSNASDVQTSSYLYVYIREKQLWRNIRIANGQFHRFENFVRQTIGQPAAIGYVQSLVQSHELLQQQQQQQQQQQRAAAVAVAVVAAAAAAAAGSSSIQYIH